MLRRAFAALQVVGLRPVATALVAPPPGPDCGAESNVRAPLICRNQFRFGHVPDRLEGAMAQQGDGEDVGPWEP